MSWLGALVTFQVTFTELFIAATVIAAGAYRYGWRSVAVGSVLGAMAVALLAAVLQAAAYRFALHLVDWISALLLLGFGAYLTVEFVQGLRAGAEHEAGATSGPEGRARSLNLAGIGIAAWALIAEGVEILVVWLGVTLRQGAVTATLGVAIGLAVVGTLALLLGRAGIFRRIPGHILDGIAAVMVTGYGLYFLATALSATA